MYLGHRHELKNLVQSIFPCFQVCHSQAFREKSLMPWLLVKRDGEVLLAHCTCMAGLGEACSHIAAVLFYVEVLARRRDRSCTDGLEILVVRAVARQVAAAVSGTVHHFDAETANYLGQGVSKPTPR